MHAHYLIRVLFNAMSVPFLQRRLDFTVCVVGITILQWHHNAGVRRQRKDQKQQSVYPHCAHHKSPLPKGPATSVPERLPLPGKLIIAKVFSGEQPSHREGGQGRETCEGLTYCELSYRGYEPLFIIWA